MNGKQLALVGIAIAAVVASFFVGRGTAGSSHAKVVAPTSTVTRATTTSTTTTTTVPATSTTTAPPRVSPVVPSLQEISLEMSRTVEIKAETEHFSADADPVTVSDGAGGWLTGIIGVRFPTADGYGQLVFFWHNTTFVGTDTQNESDQIMKVTAGAPGTLAVRYTHYAGSDPLCCPTLAPVTIDFHWDGHTMTPGGLPPGHQAGEPATITTLP